MKSLSILLLLIVIPGCDIFDTREAEEPDQPRSNYQQAITPDILIDNLINALNDKDVNNYINCFTDSSFSEKKFRFAPSSGATIKFPSLNTDWSIADEEQYLNNIKSQSGEQGGILLTLSKSTQSPQGDSLIFTSEYLLNIPSIGDNPTLFQGNLIFSMIRDSRSVWTIYFWQDNKNSDLPTWSELKGRFY